MTERDLDSRRSTYFNVNSAIAAMDNAAIGALLDQGESTPGWGKHQTADIEGTTVFVKSIPVTDLEYEHAFSTRNLYEMPLYYNYGVGSAGFGAFRELLTHVLTTNWVLDDQTPSFPLLYGFRLLPSSGERMVIDAQRRNGYVAYWNGNEAIGRYFDERMKARYDLALFLEHVPYTLHPWLVEHPDACEGVLDDLRGAISFLRAHGVVHFDAHFFNILTDGERAYLTDFGLALSRNFDLTAEELQFLADHEFYDYGEVLWSAGRVLLDLYANHLSEEGRRAAMDAAGIAADTPSRDVLGALVRNVEALAAAMALPRGLIDPIVRHREVILLMEDFYNSMHTNNSKDTRLDLAGLERSLRASGYVDP